MVLCITHSNDFYTIDNVQQSLQKAGIRTFRLNTDEFGSGCRFSYTLNNAAPDFVLEIHNERIAASQVKAVWYRKLWELQVPEELDPAWRQAYLNQYQTHRQIFLNAIQHVPWMNDMIAAQAICRDKMQQLAAARAAGCCLPRTVFTNDPVVVSDFFRQCEGNVIMKLHNPLSMSMQGGGPFFPTTRLTEDALPHLQSLVYCPMIFQEYIDKQYELRVVYVDGHFFTGKIDASYNQVTDWRTIHGGTSIWQPYKLPAQERHRIHDMMHRLGLSFGAIDLIRHVNGNYYFLEVNPFGEWGMLEKKLGYPISETIAEKIITGIQYEQ
jgi:Glutathione synthase/Ribosomal protein S6 modification enzyme (glutaminyl transferase)